MARANEIKNEWISTSEVSNWDAWTLQFVFVCKFGTKKDADDVLPRLKKDIATLRAQLSARALARLIGALSRLLDRNLASDLVLSCLSEIVSVHSMPLSYSSEWTGIIHKLLKYMGLDLQKEAVDLIFAFNKSDSLEAFLFFVATVPSEYLENSQQCSPILETTLLTPNCADVIGKFSDIQKTQLLVNVLTVEGTHFSTVDYLVHASIISTMNFSVKVQSDYDEDDLVQESRIDSELNGREVAVSEKAGQVLLVLYSSNYITHAFNQLQQPGTDTKLAVHFISLLMFLFPESRTKLCMMMTIMPGLDHWMFIQLSTHPAYIEFKRQVQHSDTVSMESLSKILELDDILLFLNLLHTYEQLLSYWLIVANDLDSANGDRFVHRDMLDFTGFLKLFCLTLIFRSNDNMSNLPRDFTRLKDISLSLLNQLYINNLRLKYLPEGFWTLKSLKFEIDLMIQIILESEENRKELENLSSDEENEERSFSKPRHRTPDMASKLEVLNKVPFFVDFTDRVKVFQCLIDAEQLQLSDNTPWLFFDGPQTTKLAADIYRENVLESSFERFHKVGSQFKNKLQVTFYNEHGVEAGVDGGGLTKEFLTSVVAEGFGSHNPLRLFLETEAGFELYPNPDIFLKILKRIDLPDQQQRLQYMRYLGMIVGKCLYEHVLIDVAFAPFFLAKWRVAQNSKKSSINDLKYLDRELYHNLNKLLEMNDEQIQQLDLDFTINEQVDSGTLQYDLQPPHGETIKVTPANRLNYIHQIANFKLNQSLHIQTKYFLEGLFNLINATWLNMFDPFELQMLISGGNDVNIKDWKDNVLYGGYFDDDTTVVLFWEVVEEMSPQERCDLIKFVTSVSRAPLLGFGALSPKFGIHNSGASNRLPTASTCVNLLKLPDYKDKLLIRQKLLYSISANSGFDLS